MTGGCSDGVFQSAGGVLAEEKRGCNIDSTFLTTKHRRTNYCTTVVSHSPSIAGKTTAGIEVALDYHQILLIVLARLSVCGEFG